MRRTTLAIAALATAGLVLFTACGDNSGAQTIRPAAETAGSDASSGIAARGVGSVKGKPDTLTVSLGVETRAARAADALAANNEKAKALIDTLKSKGVDEKDIQTSQLSIYPTFDPNGNQRITGYQVNNSVTAILHDLANAGALIDAAADAAGDAIRVNSMGFSIDDDGALKAAARSEAVRAARAQAEQLAEAAGVKLGRLRSVSEISGGGGPIPYPLANAGAADGAKMSAPIEAGTQELQLQVDAVFDIAS